MNTGNSAEVLSILSVMAVLGVLLSIISGCATSTESDRILRERMDWLEDAQSELMTRHDEAFSINEAEALIGRSPDAQCSMGELQALLDMWLMQQEDMTGDWPELANVFADAIDFVSRRHSLSSVEAKQQFSDYVVSVYFWDVPGKLVVRIGAVFPHTRVQEGLTLNFLLFARGELIKVGAAGWPVDAFDAVRAELRRQ